MDYPGYMLIMDNLGRNLLVFVFVLVKEKKKKWASGVLTDYYRSNGTPL